MIDHLTPAEGVVFAALIALGIIGLGWGSDSTQFVAAIVLAAGFWGGTVALVRGLLHRPAGGLYLLMAMGATLALVIKYVVFPSDSIEDDRYFWVLLGGAALGGVVGTALNALIRPEKQPVRPVPTPSQAAPFGAPAPGFTPPAEGEGAAEAPAPADTGEPAT